MAYFDLSKSNLAKLMYWKRSNPNCNCNRSDLSGTEDHLQQKCQIQDYQNKDKLSAMQGTFTAAKTWTGPHKIFDWAACGPWVGHSCPSRCNHLGEFHSTCFARVCEIFTVVVSEPQRGPYAMGGGTFSKWGGTSARWKEFIANFCGLNWQLWRHKHWNMT